MHDASWKREANGSLACVSPHAPRFRLAHRRERPASEGRGAKAPKAAAQS